MNKQFIVTILLLFSAAIGSMSVYSYLKNEPEELITGVDENSFWNQLHHLHQLDGIIAYSNQKTIVIFKHSILCSISAKALKNFEKNWDTTIPDVDLYYLDLINFRNVSNAIAEKLNVIHQSPQVIVLQKGKVVHHSSHDKIDARKIKKIIQNK